MASWFRGLFSTQWLLLLPAIIVGLVLRFAGWWGGLNRPRLLLVPVGLLLVVVVVPLAVLTWSGVSAALDARQKYRELQDELSHLTPVDLIQVTVYQSLEGRFQEAEEASSQANSRFGFLRAFQWVPVLGGG